MAVILLPLSTRGLGRGEHGPVAGLLAKDTREQQVDDESTAMVPKPTNDGVYKLCV